MFLVSFSFFFVCSSLCLRFFCLGGGLFFIFFIGDSDRDLDSFFLLEDLMGFKVILRIFLVGVEWVFFCLLSLDILNLMLSLLFFCFSFFIRRFLFFNLFFRRFIFFCIFFILIFRFVEGYKEKNRN